jgi:hypothetical protein
MRTLLAAVLATVIVAAPCMAANENQEDKAPGDALTPGVNEPRTPDTLKSAPDQRIQTEGRASEGRASEEGTVGERNRALDEKKVPNEKRNEEKK